MTDILHRPFSNSFCVFIVITLCSQVPINHNFSDNGLVVTRHYRKQWNHFNDTYMRHTASMSLNVIFDYVSQTFVYWWKFYWHVFLGSLWWLLLRVFRIAFNNFVSLQWCHNERNGVWNHRRLDCLLNRLFRRKSKKSSKLRVTSLCEGNPPLPVDSPHKRPVMRKCFHFMTLSFY